MGGVLVRALWSELYLASKIIKRTSIVELVHIPRCIHYSRRL